MTWSDIHQLLDEILLKNLGVVTPTKYKNPSMPNQDSLRLPVSKTMFPWNYANNISGNILKHTRSRPSPCWAIEGFTPFRTASMNQRYVNGVDVVVGRKVVHKCCPSKFGKETKRDKTCV